MAMATCPKCGRKRQFNDDALRWENMKRLFNRFNSEGCGVLDMACLKLKVRPDNCGQWHGQNAHTGQTPVTLERLSDD